MVKSKIIDSLLRAQKVAKVNGGNIIKSKQLSRKDRELLKRTNWLMKIIKGWYLLVKPDGFFGDSTVWYANFWDFLRIYLEHHFDKKYCLSAENSIDLHSGLSNIPRQVIVISTKGGGVPQELPYSTSVFIYSSKNFPEEKTTIFGLQVMTLSYALCRVSFAYFQKNPKEAEIALKMIKNSSELSEILVKYNLKSAADRLIGAYEFLKNHKIAEELRNDLALVGWKINAQNPFKVAAPLIINVKLQSPYVGRILSMWEDYRKKIILHFPKPFLKINKNYLDRLEDLYEKDAYNSLSIEGYKVDEDLIERVRNNNWNPDLYPQDQFEKNALAARGYYEAFLEVKKSINKIIEKNSPGSVVEKDLKKWYQTLFSPMVRSGIIRNEDLLGYRKGQVFIRNSRHVPLPREALLDAMDTFFDCLKQEKNSAVRAILGHYVFVYIHPYMDGNGRLGRFLMNCMLVSGGYPWTIVQVKNRLEYLNTLELTGAESNIEPFVKFLVKEMTRKK